MAHEVESMFYSKEIPWHKLGHYVGDDPITSDKAIIAAGLDWEVVKEPIFHVSTENINNSLFQKIEENFIIKRQTDSKVLGLVGNRYRPLQNKEAFTFIDSLVENKSIKYETAGSLQGGKKVWLLASLGQFDVVKNDTVKKYILLFNSHDGSSSVNIVPTSTRVVCMNTARIALSKGKSESLKIRHTGDISNKKIEAMNLLGILNNQFNDYEQKMKSFGRKQLSSNKVEEFLSSLLKKPKEGRSLLFRNKKADKIKELFESGIGNDQKEVRGTSWAMYNAVTEFLNYWDVKGKTEEEREEKQFQKNIIQIPHLLKRTEELLVQNL